MSLQPLEKSQNGTHQTQIRSNINIYLHALRNNLICNDLTHFVITPNFWCSRSKSQVVVFTLSRRETQS